MALFSGLLSTLVEFCKLLVSPSVTYNMLDYEEGKDFLIEPHYGKHVIMACFANLEKGDRLVVPVNGKPRTFTVEDVEYYDGEYFQALIK